MPEELCLDVARPLEVPLAEDRAVAESRLGLALCRGERVLELAGRADDAHAAPASAGGCLDEERIPDLLGRALRNGGHAGLARDALRCELVATEPERGRRGPTQVSPAAITASAKSPFSARKP